MNELVLHIITEALRTAQRTQGPTSHTYNAELVLRQIEPIIERDILLKNMGSHHHIKGDCPHCGANE